MRQGAGVEPADDYRQVTQIALPVGAGLLAKRPAHSTSVLAEPPLSRASPLPQKSNSTWLSNNPQRLNNGC
ncbi:hypothetical protein C5612_06945 [Pseudomonas frederiksbergensis]|uniref:Uncharacterized protein n=1 Tax=Pseudomonas frederiksbergensis TaxID=104087 RepID=A0A2S8HSN7_9PSED|nr:hypothetical protein C5612_06945 [Pseudomonas frederiksbergensis]